MPVSSPRGATRGSSNKKIGRVRRRGQSGHEGVGEQRSELAGADDGTEPRCGRVDLVEVPASIASRNHGAAAAGRVEQRPGGSATAAPACS